MLPFSEVLLTTLFAARQEDPRLARQLKVVTTSAGSPRPFTRRIKAEGLIHQHKVGTTAQAVKARDCGVDAIVASGYEMGGHTNPMRVHTFVLGPNVVDAVPEIPIVLSGGVRDGRGLAAALLFGADAVAMGTRFVTTVENSDWHPDFLAAVVAMREGDDVAFAGNYGPCRGLRNAGDDWRCRLTRRAATAIWRRSTPSSRTCGEPRTRATSRAAWCWPARLPAVSAALSA